MVKENMDNWIFPIKERFKLSEHFLKDYEGKEPEWGPLGKLTYKRTYAARIEGEDRTEEWWETVKRVVEACYTIQLNHCKNLRLPWNAHKAQKSAQEMYTRMFEFKFIPPGRGLANMGDLIFKRGSMPLFNCFQYDTEIITRDGIKKIGDCANTEQELLVNNSWIKSPIKEYGIQQLYKLELTRNNKKKTIYTTKDHNWYAKDRRQAYRNKNITEFKTYELRPNVHRLQYSFTSNYKNVVEPSPFGISHGICFGDGSSRKNINESNVLILCGEKDEQLLKYFNNCSIKKMKTSENECTKIYVGNIPNHFKELPNIRENKSYLLGWLMGYFAADGSCAKNKSGNICLSSTNKNNLKFVKDVCNVLGIGTYTITKTKRISNLTNSESILYTLHLMGETLSKDFFLINEHKENFKTNKKELNKKRYWTVKSVEATDRFEPVFCAEVEKYHKFTLADNILTGNCSAVSSDSVNFSDPYVFMMDVSMNGVGCGFDTNGAGKFKIVEPKTTDQEYIVDDSKDGWCDVLRIVLESFVGKEHLPLNINYSKIRPAGTPIVTSGGIAPGPEPLIKCINDITEFLKERIGKEISSGDIVDIMNMVGVCVVSGGKRRCLPEYTDVHTKDGLIPIKDVKVGQEVLTMDGWKKVVDHIYQGKQPIVNIKTKLGDFKCTPQHRMKVYSTTNTFEFKKAEDIKSGERMVFFYDNNFEMGLKNNLVTYENNIYKLSSEFISKLRTGSFPLKINLFHTICADLDTHILSNKYDAMSFQNILASIGVISSLKELSDEDGYILQYDKNKFKEIDTSFKTGDNENLNNSTPIEVLEIEYLNIEEETYDISVEDNHEFVCGPGLVSHNTAQIAFGDYNDDEYISLKDPDLYSKEMMSHRWASNNSVYADDGMDYNKIVNTIKKSGEPGILYKHRMQNYGRMKDGFKEGIDANATLLNPCGEISLESEELCNISDVFPARHDTFEDFKKSLKFAFLYCKTVTLVPTHLPTTNSKILKNRRIGVSQSGIVQAIQKHGANRYFKWCDEGYNYLTYLDKKYSDWLCIQKSIKLTSVKPSGCRTKDGLLTTENGIYTLEELFKNHEKEIQWKDFNKDLNVIQDNSNNKILKTFRNGLSETIKIKTNYNFELESTPNHMWFVKNNYNREKHKITQINDWVRADELKFGDILDINLNIYNSEKSYEFKTIECPESVCESVKNHNIIKQPKYMTDDLAWMLGYLWGDGTLSENKFRIRFIDQNKYNLEKVSDILNEYFGLHKNIRKCKNRDAYTYECGSRFLWNWLKENEIWKYGIDSNGLKKLADIPKCIRYSSKNNILAFVAGLIDSDGCVSLGKDNQLKLQITTSYEEFAKHLQQVLFSVGIVIGRSNNTKGQNHQCKSKSKNIWLMQINQNTEISSFEQLKLNSNKMKYFSEKYPKSIWTCIQRSKNKLYVGKVIGIEKSEKLVETFDVEIENEPWYYAGATKSHNTTSLLMDATPGIHFPHSEYYIRRIRIEETNEKLVNAVKKAGYKWEVSAYGDRSIVFEVPVKCKNFYKGKEEATIWEQMQLGVKLQHFWSDNSVSQTITFNKDEAEYLVNVIELFEDSLKTVSFLPVSDHSYVQAPYETITKEEYEERIKSIKEIDFNFKETNDNIEKFCDGDSCVI